MDAVGEDERVAIKVLNVRKLAVPTYPLMRKKLYAIKSVLSHQSAPIVQQSSPRVGGEGGTLVNVCRVCAVGISEPLPHYSLFFGQL